MGAKVRRVKSYTRGGKQAGRVRGYVAHGGGFNRRLSTKVGRNVRRTAVGKTAPPKTRVGRNVTRTRVGRVSSGGGSTGSDRSKGGLSSSGGKVKTRKSPTSPKGHKPSSVGKANTRKPGAKRQKVKPVKATSRSNPSRGTTVHAVEDMQHALQSLIREAKGNPRGTPIGTKGVVRIGPDRRTAEQKRNPRRVRKG